MRKVTAVLQKAQKAIHDFDLLKILQSEINHELSTKTFQVTLVLLKIFIFCLVFLAIVVDGMEVAGIS